MDYGITGSSDKMEINKESRLEVFNQRLSNLVAQSKGALALIDELFSKLTGEGEGVIEDGERPNPIGLLEKIDVNIIDINSNITDLYKKLNELEKII